MHKKRSESQGNEANHSRRTLEIVKMVKKKRRKIMQGVIDLPIPVLLVLVCDGVFVGGIVDQGIIEQFFPDEFGRIKVQAEEIGRTFELSFLGIRENGETGFRETCRCAFPTNLQWNFKPRQ